MLEPPAGHWRNGRTAGRDGEAAGLEGQAGVRDGAQVKAEDEGAILSAGRTPLCE